MGTVKDRQEFVFVSECLQGQFDISTVTKKARWQRRLLTKILDRWLDSGFISDYRMSVGRSVTDAFGTYGTGVRLMVDFFSGYKEIPITRYCRHKLMGMYDNLPDLPEYDNRPLNHDYQGEKHPFQYTAIQRQIEDAREREQYLCSITGEDFKLAEPAPVVVEQTERQAMDISEMEDIF